MRQIKNLALCLGLVLGSALAINAGTVDQQPAFDKVELRSSITEKVVGIYTAEIGVRELTGRNDGVRVEQYLATTGIDKGNPWCAAFVSWTFIQADVMAITSAWSPSWFPPSKTIYTKGKHSDTAPRQADVFGIYFPDKGRIAHVGFVDSWPAGDYLLTVEGNTNNAGSREGDGVYRKRRLKANIYKVSRWV